MPKRHVKKGDRVVIISGTGYLSRGRVLKVLPREGRVIVEGHRMIKRHTRKSQQHPQGAIVEREGTVHLSNVMLEARFDARAQRRGAGAGGAAAAPAEGGAT